MNFLKKGLAQVSAAVEKAREATTMGGTSGEGAMAGSRSSGALPSAPGAPAGTGAHATRAARVLPDLSTLPEIRFDPRDPNEAHVAFLWSVLEGAPKNTQPHDDALASFLDGFAAAYGAWTPTPGFADDMALPDDASERQRHAPGGSLTGCTTGHPGGVLRALAEATPRRRRALESALDVGASGAAMPGAAADGAENDTALANAAGLDLFDALRIAARSAHNRAVLASHGVLDELALTLQLATRRQNALAADMSAVVLAGGTTTSANAAARAEATARVRVLQCVSARIVDVLREYLEVPEERRTSSRRRGDDESPRRRDAGPAPAVKPLLECGALGALVETVRVQTLVRARVVDARAEAGARALERGALRALDGATGDSVAAQNALRASGGLDVVVQSLGDPRAADLEPGTSESRASVAARIAALRALRSATRRNGQSARDAAASGVFGEPLAGTLEAAAAEDAARAFATRSVDTADRSAHDADASVDPMSVALREADVAPPGACLAEAFGVLRGFVVADRGVPGEADADLESDRAVREGLLPAIVRAALASIADPNGRLNRDGGVRREASSARPGREIRGDSRREREALSSVSAADAFAGSGKKASRETRNGEAASAFAGAGPAPPGGGGGGEGGFVVATGNPFADSAEADDAFGGAFGGDHPPDTRDRSGGVAGAANPPADPEAVREAAARLLRAHVCSFLRALLMKCEDPRAVLDALRAADAWRRLLDDDGAFGSAAQGAPPPRFPRAFGAASQSLALWLQGARVAGDTVGHADARSGFPPANLAGSAPEVLAVLDTLVARAAQPAAAAALASALARLRDIAPRAAGAAMLRADAPAKLGAAAAAQFRAWGARPAASAAVDASALEDCPEDCEDCATSPVSSAGETGDGENETDDARVAARDATLSLLSSALEDGGAALGAGALTASPLIDLLFELLWRSETRAFAVKSLVALITSRCRRSQETRRETAASALEAENAWDALVRRFLETLPAAREAAAGRGALGNVTTESQGFGPLSDMLAGLRFALAGPGGKELRARLASQGGPGANASPAYVQVVSLLNAEGGSGGEAAALECVCTLRSLLSGSETAARAFGRDVGYDTFAHALEAAWGTEPVSEALARSVLELAVDADLPTPTSPSVEGDASEPIVPAGAAIRNAGALPVLLTLLRRAALPVRRWGLGALAALLASAVRSRAAADQSDALGFLLDWFAEEALHGEALSSPGTDREDHDAKTTVKTVPELISQCIGLCASHSLSARHFRGAFRILRDADVPAGARRAVLRALRLAAKREGPAAYFDLAPGIPDASGADVEDGPGCLALRRPPAWPSGRAGYTFAAWLRVESWRSEHLSERLGAAEPNPKKGSDDAERLAPRVALFAMRGASGTGVAAELGPSGVWLRVLEHAKAERVLLDARIETKRWMFVAVAHAPARPPLSSATARLYVDGELVSSKKLRFPRVAEPLTSCAIGAFDAFDAAAARVPERGDASFVSASSSGSENSAEPFRGQIGVVRFFDDALSAAAVAAAAALGPDYVGAFSPTETASGIALANFGMSHSEAREIREALAPRLVLSLNAAAATGRSCFSTVADPAGGGVLAALAAARARVESRIKDGVAGAMAGIASGDTVPGDGTSASGTSPVAAELAGAARVCATHSAKDVVHCLGGVHVLFPLLAPGALGSGDEPRARSSELLVSKKMNATLDSNGPGLVVDAVDLLASLLEGSRLNQEALHTSGGFALVGRLLKMDGGARLSPALLPSAERLVRSVGRYAWAGPGNDPDQAAVRLLLDPHLWGAPRVSTETLAAHSAFLRRLAKRDPEALRALLPPPALVDAAAETGNGSGSGRSTVAVGATGHLDDDVVRSDETNTNRRVTTPPDGSRPRRRALLAVAGAVLPGAAPALFSETAAAAAFAVEDAGASADAEAGGAIATDVLDALVEWLQPDHPASRQLSVAIAAVCGGPAMVLAPMARPHAETRALAIRLLAALLPRSRAPAEACPGAAGAPGGGGGAGGGGGRAGLTPAAPAGNLDRLTAAPGAFVHSISSAMSSNFAAGGAGERAGGGGAAAAGGGGGSRSLHAPPGLFPAVAAALLPYPLTHGVRAALFELMLGGQPVPAGRVRPLPRARSKTRFTRVSSAVSSAASAAGRFLGSHSRSASLSDGSFAPEGGAGMGNLSSPLRLDGGIGAATSGVPGIVHAAAAGVLLRLLEKCEDAEVRGGALETLLRLVEGAPANAHALLTQAGWQQWLIPALCAGARRRKGALHQAQQAQQARVSEGQSASKEASEDPPDATDLDPDEEARLLTRRLLRALLSHATLRVENGCAAVVTTGDVIAAAAERGRLDGPRTTRALLGDIFDAVAEEAPVAQFAATRRDNLFGLLPLAEETVARAAAAAAGSLVTTHTRSSHTRSSRDRDDGADKSSKSSGEADGSGSGDETAKPAKPLFDEDDWQMLDGTWRLLEELAKDATPSPTSTHALASGGEAASVRVGGINAGDRESSTRLAALQRTAFHLAIVYVHAAPSEASSLSAALQSLESLFPALLSVSSRGNAESARAGAARLHLFLTSLVRAEATFAGADPARAQLAARLARGAASAGGALLDLSPGSNASLASLAGTGGGGGTPDAPPGASGVLADLRERISEQKAASAAAEDARDLRRAADARRAAAVAAADAAAVAFSREQLDERALVERRAGALASLCARERARRVSARAAREEEAQTLDLRWRTLRRELFGDTGLWARTPRLHDADAFFSARSEPHAYKWKLDKSEDSCGRRLRLKRNYRFVAYRDERDGGASKDAKDAADASDASDASVRLLGDAVKARKPTHAGDTEDAFETENENDEDETPPDARAAEDGESGGSNPAASDPPAQIDLSPEDKKKVLLSVPATLVNAKRAVVGRADISRGWVHFVADEPPLSRGDAAAAADAKKNAGEIPPSKKRFWRWPTSRVDEVHHARYRLQHVAVELYLSDGRSVFLAFLDKKTARDAASKIAASRADIALFDRKKKLEAAKLAQERWRARRMSTFEYLASLNALAGRTRNDLTQYPVFPWVLADYVSDTIDLTRRDQFRDLSKPIGALEPKRARQFEERFALLAEDPESPHPPFHYGSHYSSAAAVLHFLLRLEPFTALARQLQGGRFDHADRLFRSVARAWEGCLASTADVKELTPEFYSLPEFLVNADGRDFGAAQDGAAVHDVELPPWAKGSPHEFVRVMREALESDVVSASLHEWVDLVFGCAQQGREAVRRKNVFHHLTYEGSVDLNAIADPARRAAAEAHVMNFGQTPAQLFRKPHPRRAPPPSPPPALRYAPGRIDLVGVVEPKSSAGGEKTSPVAFVSADGAGAGAGAGGASVLGSMTSTASARQALEASCQYRIVAVRADGTVGAHRLAFDAAVTREYSLECDAFGGGSSRRAPASPFAADAAARLSPQSFATLAGGRVLLSCGHWDHGVRAAATEDGRELQIATGHRDLVTCLAVAALGAGAARRPWAKKRVFSPEGVGAGLDAGGVSSDADAASALVVSGSRDTTLCVWEVSPPPGGWGAALSRSGTARAAQLSFARGGGLGERPKRTLFGHDDAVTCAAVSAELDLVASGGADGAVLLHALRAGRFLRALRRGRPASRAKSVKDPEDASARPWTGAFELGAPSWVALLEGRVGAARVLVYGGDALALSCFGLNADADAPPLAFVSLAERVNALCVTPDERFIALAQERGSIAVRATHDLSPWAKLEGPGPAVTAVRVAADDVFVGGLRDGRIAVWAPART
jgi:hypothetical protein